jgi:RNA polymerase sigma-70 factor (ECF subfamily)
MTGIEGEYPDDGLHSLVATAIARDPEAIRLLWDRQRRWVAALRLAYKPREADLEDLLQEVAMAFVRKIGELREPEAFKPWLRSVAINAARLAGRKQTTARKHTQRLRLVVERDTERPATPDVVSAKREEGKRLLDLAMEMPESYREPLLLRCVHGMSYREISRIIGLPETTIETRIARGRRMLRERAAGQESARRTEPSLPDGTLEPAPTSQKPGRPSVGGQDEEGSAR